MLSDLVIDDSVITPTCARCSTLFAVGEVKEVESRGRITKLKISDSTALINLYMYTDIAARMKLRLRLSTVEPEYLLAFMGKPRVRVHPPEKSFLIIDGEACASVCAAEVDAGVRDNWILSTAIRTMERIEQLRSHLPTITTSWMDRAMRHYGDGDKLDECESIALEAVQQLWLHYNKTAKEIALDFLNTVDKSSREVLMAELSKRGLRGRWMEEVIDELIADGRCYEPESGFLALVSRT